MVMLETMQEYARDRLEASGEAEEVRRRHAAYLVALAEAAEPELMGPHQGEWVQRLEAEHANLRAVLTWSREQAAWEVGLRLAGALWRFWERHGHLSEGRRWLEGLLAQAGSNLPAGAGTVRAKALRAAAQLAWRQDDYGQAVALGEESLRLYREVGDRAGIAYSLNILATVAWQQGDYARATALFEESLALFRELGDKDGTAWVLINLGVIVGNQGDHGRAAALYREGLALFRELGDNNGMGWALIGLGQSARARGDAWQATVLFKESLAVFRGVEHKPGIGFALNCLGLATCEQGDYGRATALYAESLALCRETGNKYLAAHCLEGLAGVASAQGQPERAARLFGAAEATRRLIGVPLPPSERPHYERLVAAVRTQLDEGTFAAAWTAGQALSLEQAIAEALGEESSV